MSPGHQPHSGKGGQPRGHAHGHVSWWLLTEVQMSLPAPSVLSQAAALLTCLRSQGPSLMEMHVPPYAGSPPLAQWVSPVCEDGTGRLVGGTVPRSGLGQALLSSERSGWAPETRQEDLLTPLAPARSSAQLS